MRVSLIERCLAGILVVTALLKLIALLRPYPALALDDPVFWVSNRVVMQAVASAEAVVAMYLLFGRERAVKIALVVLLAFGFCVYRHAHSLAYAPVTCPCLGSEMSWWGWGNRHLSQLATGIFVAYLTLAIVYVAAIALQSRGQVCKPMGPRRDYMKIETVCIAVVVSFCSLFSYISYRGAARSLHSTSGADVYSSEDELISKVWKRWPFVPVADTPAFRSKIQNAIGAEAVVENKNAAADLVYKFALAYCSDDFGAFCRFRMPAGGVTVTAPAREVLRMYLNALARRGVSFELVDCATCDPVVALRTAWFAAVAARKGGADRERPGEPYIGLCTNCIDAVAPASIRIRSISPEEIESRNLLRTLTHGPNWGASIAPTFVTFKTKAEVGRMIDIQFMLRLKSGYVHPVHLIAFWDSVSLAYIPMRLAMPTATRERAMVLF